MSKHNSELVLGTAQLGSPVIAGNELGRPSENEASLILKSAMNAGIRWIETSANYGLSEQRIGAALPGSKGAKIITKLAQLDRAASPGSQRRAVIDSVQRSCARLNVHRLDLLLLNNTEQLQSQSITGTIAGLQNEGLVFDLGVSVSSPEEALSALECENIQHLEIQFNALDWRWRDSGAQAAIEARPGISIHAHSVLLQGLLAAAPAAKWPSLSDVDSDDFKSKLWLLARQLGRDSPADLCLAYVRAQSWINGIIIGARSTSQLALSVARFKRPPLTEAQVAFVNKFLPRAPLQLLNPAGWAQAA